MKMEIEIGGGKQRLLEIIKLHMRKEQEAKLQKQMKVIKIYIKIQQGFRNYIVIIRDQERQ